MDFHIVKTAVAERFEELSKHKLFQVNIPKRDTLVDIYLNSFPEEERQHHNCNCCKSFIRQYGNIVAIIDGKLQSIWHITELKEWDSILNNLHSYIVNRPIESIFLTDISKLGTDYNYQTIKQGQIKWEHFQVIYPTNKLVRKDSIDSLKSENRSIVQVFGRSLKEITLDACNTVLDLTNQNSLYRGLDYKPRLEKFIQHKTKFDFLSDQEKELYIWQHADRSLAIRNDAIGTLLVDLSNDMELDKAVRKYEDIVAPANYKRPTALVTPKMIDAAKKTIEELGLTSSLQRHYATESDIPVTQMLYVDRSFKIKDVFDELKESTLVNPRKLTKVEEVSLDQFIENILPTATSVELLLENKHSSNFMALTSAVDKNAPKLFSWESDLAWTYTGDVTDSMKERVKRAGGDVSGELRFSIMWNEEGNNNNDFDAHAIEPDRNHIYFSNNKGYRSRLSGMLDVDIISPSGKIAVENITWSKAPKGDLHFFVKNFSSNRSKYGFKAEIEFKGQVFNFEYNIPLNGSEEVTVAKVTITESEIIFNQSLISISGISSKQIWNIGTNQFHKVKLITQSPNYLNEDSKGNKHIFFILENAKSPEPVRGFFNEYLKPELHQHRKVFELLGDKLKVSQNDSQLAGLGFSITQRNDFIVKVKGSFERTLKVNV